jgi:hypothetical protein
MQYFENSMDCSGNSQEYIRPVLFGVVATNGRLFSISKITILLENRLIFFSDQPAGEWRSAVETQA